MLDAAVVFWWKRVDSDHRSETQQIYSLPPLATRERFLILSSRYRERACRYISSTQFIFIVCRQKNGAGGRTRTPDLLITNQLLYQLSYTSVSLLDYYITTLLVCQALF